jgi:hypothetical protein
MSIIAAGNTTTTALVQTADTTGNLVFTTGGANTTALTLSNAQAATFAGAVTITGTSTHTGNASFSNITATGTLSTASQGIAFASLPTGSVLQVVSATYNTSTSTSTDTMVDTGLTATITPKFSTSKILILINQNGLAKAPTNINNCISLRLLRGATNLVGFGVFIGYTNSATDNIMSTASFTYLDSPATTSATTYKTQFSSALNSGAVTVQNNAGTSSITLMEIAA